MLSCLYARTSTEEQGQSNNNQVQYIKDYCTKNNIPLDNTLYVDEHTGVNFNRPALIKMLNKCGLKYISEYNIFVIDKTLPVIYNNIYCTHSSRFSRSVQVLELYQLLLKQGVIVHFIQENRDTTVFNSSTENFIFSIQSLLNANTSRETSAKVVEGLRSASQRGRILVPGTGLYGYDYDKLNNRLIPNTDEVIVVNKIFDLYLEGNGMKKICNYLNSNNVPTKKGGKWSNETIRTILTNRKYIGESTRMKQHRSKLTHDTKVSTRPKDEWIIIKYGDKLPDGTIFKSIPPIVDEDTFNKVQERLKSRISAKNGKYRGTSILSGKIKCALCGHNYQINSWSAKGIKHEFYTCSNKHLNTKAVCNNSNVQLDKLEQVLNSDWVNGLVLRKKLLRANTIQAEIVALQNQLSKYTMKDTQQLTRSIVVLEGKKKTLIDYMLEGTISKEDYKLKMAEIDNELDNTKTLIQDIQSNNTTTKYEIQRLKELKHKVLKTSINTQYDFKTVCKMIKQITVNYNILTIVIEINSVEYVDEVNI